MAISLCDRERFLPTIAPYRDDVVVAVECTSTWYWLADLCARRGISYVLGHAFYMKAIHGLKARSDEIDSSNTVATPRGYPQAGRKNNGALRPITCNASTPAACLSRYSFADAVRWQGFQGGRRAWQSGPSFAWVAGRSGTGTERV